jgi:microcystin-dependent protein
MAYSYYNYTGDGSQTQFPVAFGYIRREHVLATVAGSPATFTWVNSSTIQMDTAPANGAVVRVYRVTPLTAPLVDFTDGATLVAADLDTNARQSIYTQQELDDSLVEGLAGVIPNGDKGDITTSVGGTVWTIDSGAVVEAKIGTGAVTEAKIGTGAVTEAKIGTGAVTSTKIANDTIVNADINTSAAIASTKLAFAPTGNIAATTVQAAIEELDTEKAPLASPTFTGTPAAPTATAGTNTTQVATTAFVSIATAGIVTVPIGTISWFAGNTAPTGYLKANGAAISRTTYSTLFTAIGTTFGVGDGSTTFNVPDLRGEFIRGWDDARGVDSGRGFGSTQAELVGPHTHPFTVIANATTDAGSGALAGGGYNVGSDGSYSGNTSNPSGAETRPRNIALLACIKF